MRSLIHLYHNAARDALSVSPTCIRFYTAFVPAHLERSGRESKRAGKDGGTHAKHSRTTCNVVFLERNEHASTSASSLGAVVVVSCLRSVERRSVLFFRWRDDGINKSSSPSIWKNTSLRTYRRVLANSKSFVSHANIWLNFTRISLCISSFEIREKYNSRQLARAKLLVEYIFIYLRIFMSENIHVCSVNILSKDAATWTIPVLLSISDFVRENEDRHKHTAFLTQIQNRVK